MRLRQAAAAFALAVATATTAMAAEPARDFGIAGFFEWKDASGKRNAAGAAELNGVKIYYETYGAGPPVLVLHGGTAYLETMHHQIRALADNRLAVAMDSRGHGRSSDGEGPLHYHDMAEDVVALMDRLKIQKADLVGWSDGGIIGLDLALNHPDRIGRMVVIGSNFDATGLSDPEVATPADAPSLARQRDAYRRMSPTPDRWAEFYGKVAHMWRTEPRYTAADLGRIRTPVLVMAGENDSVRREHTDAMAGAIPGAKEAIIPGATHFAPLTHAEAVNAAILDFLGPASR